MHDQDDQLSYGLAQWTLQQPTASDKDTFVAAVVLEIRELSRRLQQVQEGRVEVRLRPGGHCTRVHDYEWREMED